MQLVTTGTKVTDEKQQAVAKKQMSFFLAEVEKRAFRMAVIATQNEADALDIVQEAMMKLVRYYLLNQQSEWKPLFYRILHNNIMDWHRSQKWQKKLFFWQNHSGSHPDIDDFSVDEQTPEQALAQGELSKKALKLLAQLPIKQKQCFLLRAWEGLSVKETATIMKCSEGSVKTHMHRASQKLNQLLEQEHGE